MTFLTFCHISNEKLGLMDILARWSGRSAAALLAVAAGSMSGSRCIFKFLFNTVISLVVLVKSLL